MVEHSIVYGKEICHNDAYTWNYFRGFINDNYKQLVVGEFWATVPGTRQKKKAVCTKIESNKATSVGFCTYKHLLGKHAVGSKNYQGGMGCQCRSLLSDIIDAKKESLRTSRRTAYTPKKARRNSLPTAIHILLIIFVDLRNLPCKPRMDLSLCTQYVSCPNVPHL